MSLLKNFIKVDARCRRVFLTNMVWKGWLAFRKFKNRKKKGNPFPAFQFISVTNDCNLRCQGCWVNSNGHNDHLDVDKIHELIRASIRMGSSFFGILGGEPLLYKPLTEIFEKHSDCYFQLFTNGTLFTPQIAEHLRRLSNVTPLFSFEGDEQVADIRRGGHNIYNRTLQAIDTSVNHGLITGVAISVCKSNIEMALSDEFVRMMHDRGVLYIWYYIYRPAGDKPNYDLALSADEIARLRRFLVEGRKRLPVVLIDSYWRADGEPFCPAAEGLSHHINAAGFMEPCPVIQFSRDRLNGTDPAILYEKSDFLREFKTDILHKTKGCILMEDPAWLSAFAGKHGAVNTSNRPGIMEELVNAPVVASHGSCGNIPEKSLIYRLAKRTAFFGMGAYG
jgi:MoaA/NifB/PqqE/SkfB family radical SAM enzyme